MAVTTIEIDQELDSYNHLALKQLDQIVLGTVNFVTAVKNVELEEAKSIYPLVRMYFGRSNPIAKSFGNLDPRIDARLIGVTVLYERQQEKVLFYE